MNPLGLRHPSTTCCFGSSMSGKTSFTIRLVKNAEKVYNNKFDAIIWCHEAGESAVPREELKDVANLRFHRGLPPSFSSFPRNSLIICDDCTKEGANSDTIYKASLMGTHHLQQSLLLILHNIFTPGRNFKSVSVNSHYYVLFRSPRDRSQIDIFFRQLEPKRWRQLRDIYDQEVVAIPFNYLLIDCHPASAAELAPFRFKNNIFPDDKAGQFFCTSEQLNQLKNEKDEN